LFGCEAVRRTPHSGLPCERRRNEALASRYPTRVFVAVGIKPSDHGEAFGVSERLSRRPGALAQGLGPRSARRGLSVIGPNVLNRKKINLPPAQQQRGDPLNRMISVIGQLPRGGLPLLNASKASSESNRTAAVAARDNGATFVCSATRRPVKVGGSCRAAPVGAPSWAFTLRAINGEKRLRGASSGPGERRRVLQMFVHRLQLVQIFRCKIVVGGWGGEKTVAPFLRSMSLRRYARAYSAGLFAAYACLAVDRARRVPIVCPSFRAPEGAVCKKKLVIGNFLLCMALGKSFPTRTLPSNRRARTGGCGRSEREPTQ